MKNLDELSKDELLTLIKHYLPNTLTEGHPCYCFVCGDLEHDVCYNDGTKVEAYGYECDECYMRSITERITKDLDRIIGKFAFELNAEVTRTKIQESVDQYLQSITPKFDFKIDIVGKFENNNVHIELTPKRNI
jgi:hypothetical protein